MVLLNRWGNGHVLYVEGLRITRCDVRVVVEDTFVCKVCERADDGEDNVVDESMDLGNGVHLENVEMFCYLGDTCMLNGD